MEIFINKDSNIIKAHRIFIDSINQNEVLYLPLSEEIFSDICKNSLFLSAENNGELSGFLIANVLDKKAFITLIFVKKEFRNKGIGTELIVELQRILQDKSCKELCINHLNPTELSWHIPKSPHTHNKIPGVFKESPALEFFIKNGFNITHEETAMYRDLTGFTLPEDIKNVIAALKNEGIVVGELKDFDIEFDGLCDRVQSEYWRASIASEIYAHKHCIGNLDSHFWADDIAPTAPRKILAATYNKHMVGFTGPVDLQKDGRGWFTGLCVDPKFGRRRIGETLFNLLLQAFTEEGAQFTSLFTGSTNPAKKIYLKAGLKPVAEFAALSKGINGQ
ncbi:MAG: GNAT family N-acetyltransferase [Eubacteriales bacterium]|nr:GNAT family N-acetyltransferase [Eubacteriales bacterium]